MQEIPNWVRVIRSFLDRWDDADEATSLEAYATREQRLTAVLESGGQIFAVLKSSGDQTTAVVPEGLHDPDSRGLREVVWQEAETRGFRVCMDNDLLARMACVSLRPVPRSTADTNSRRSRVLPVFGWLSEFASADWAAEIVQLAEGLNVRADPGHVRAIHLHDEVKVPASPARLVWMLRHASALTPKDGRRWRELAARAASVRDLDALCDRLGGGLTLPDGLVLEGATSGDCVIECDQAVIWIEGKRNDWLASGTTWDSARDQLARNLEAAWQLAAPTGREFCVLICFEEELRYHDQLLVDGYRTGTWTGGVPHLDVATREAFGDRIGLLRWRELAHRWPELRALPELADLSADPASA